MGRKWITGVALVAALATVPAGAAGGYYLWQQAHVPAAANVAEMEKAIQPELQKQLDDADGMNVKVGKLDCLQPVDEPGSLKCVADTKRSGYEPDAYGEYTKDYTEKKDSVGVDVVVGRDGTYIWRVTA